MPPVRLLSRAVLRRKVPVEITAGITKAGPDKPFGNRSAGRSYSGADSCFALLPAYKDPSELTRQTFLPSEGCETDPDPKAVLLFPIHPDPDCAPVDPAASIKAPAFYGS